MEILPEELILRTAHFLFSLSDVSRLLRTCRRMVSIISDESLWKCNFFRFYKNPKNRTKNYHPKSWKNYLKKRNFIEKKWKTGQYTVKVKRNDNVLLVTSINCIGDIIIAGQGQGRIGLYDKEFDEISSSWVHKAVVWGIVVAEDQTCFSCSNDGCIAVFKIEDQKIVKIKKIQITSQMIWGLDVDIKRDIVVVGTSLGEISVFCISTEERLYHCVPKVLGIYDVCLVGDTCFASSYGPNSVVYSMSTNQFKVLTSGKASALCVFDGNVIAGSRSDKGEIDCWDVSTNTVLWTLEAGETVSDVKIFQNKIVAACLGYFRFWDRETKQHLYDIHFGAVEGRLYSLLVQEDFLICACGEQVVHVKLLEGRIRANSLNSKSAGRGGGKSL